VEAQRQPTTLVAGLGAAQLIAWGTLYYAIAVIGEPMGTELGLTRGHVFGAFAWSMVISGVLAPWAGRTLDRIGGRVVLASSAIVGALGFVVLARAHSFAGLAFGWSIQGLAMALGLYDTCFAAIGHVAPSSYRRTVTGVTLVAGFASTVSWPATHYLVQAIGWRSTCDLYAGALLLCAPIYALILPQGQHAGRVRAAAITVAHVDVAAAIRSKALLLAWAFAGTAVVGASMSAHLVGVLKALRLPNDEAVWIAASVGVMQVAGRLLELGFGSRLPPVRLGFVTFVGLFVAMLFLFFVGAIPAFVFVFAFVYGIANGLLTIAKATIPVEMFGFANVGAVLGGFSAPSLVTRALAPFGFALLMSDTGTSGAVAGLMVVSLASCAAYAAATRNDAAPSHEPKEPKAAFRA
jgi:predicted MFS family arabinose efflux permease